MTGCEGQPGAVVRVGLSHRERGQQGRTIRPGYILPPIATTPAESPPRGYISGVLCILPRCHPSTRTNAGAHHTEPTPPVPDMGRRNTIHPTLHTDSSSKNRLKNFARPILNVGGFPCVSGRPTIARVRFSCVSRANMAAVEELWMGCGRNCASCMNNCANCVKNRHNSKYNPRKF